MSLLIPKRVLGNIISHALETDPDECCGVLIGSEAVVEEARRIKNIHPQPVRRYEMPPMDLMRVESEADAKGREIVAIYHSHTHTQGYPSQTDVQNAIESGWTEPYYVLISLVEKTRPIVRAFRIAECETCRIFRVARNLPVAEDATVTEIFITTEGQPYIEIS